MRFVVDHSLISLSPEPSTAHHSGGFIRPDNHPHHNNSRVASAITGSVSASALPGAQHFLGPYACKQIHDRIIQPILREQKLKAFHPLLQSLPQRIGHKEITCLRDLEKTLVFLAPVSEMFDLGKGATAHYLFSALKKYSATKSAYLEFCEASIQCIHTTVEYLNEHDQRRPADRPYTNGYFLDLVEQIRQYAAMMLATREREAAGQPTNELDYAPYVPNLVFQLSHCSPLYSGEHLSLEGGLHENGRPAELVRSVNGKKISLATGEPYDVGTSPDLKMKRSYSEDSNDESVLRSMARRKKNADPREFEKTCEECKKVFKRPCDLSKHEKTHSRPWKCSDKTCKYNTFGWPTEKERDRHENDRHSKNPALYKCQYDRCPYESKRESNCKQHMEKAHGWTYVRSKNVSRKDGKSSAKATPRSSTMATPQTPNIQTPQTWTMGPPTPLSSVSPTDYLSPPSYNTYNNGPVYGESSTTGAAGQMAPPASNYEGSISSSGEYDQPFGPFGVDLGFEAFHATLGSSDPNAYAPVPNEISPFANTNEPPSNFDTAYIPEDLSDEVLEQFDWANSNMNNDMTSFNMQMMTPAQSTESHLNPSFSRNPSISLTDPLVTSFPHLSPGGQGNVMLYSPNSQNNMSADEGFEDFVEVGRPASDFALFDGPASSRNGTGSVSTMTGTTEMFPPLANYQYDHRMGSGFDSQGLNIAMDGFEDESMDMQY